MLDFTISHLYGGIPAASPQLGANGSVAFGRMGMGREGRVRTIDAGPQRLSPYPFEEIGSTHMDQWDLGCGVFNPYGGKAGFATIWSLLES
jgi:hypothetical protein